MTPPLVNPNVLGAGAVDIRLTGRHISVAGECEVKNAQAMKILDLFGAGASFAEFYLSDFKSQERQAIDVPLAPLTTCGWWNARPQLGHFVTDTSWFFAAQPRGALTFVTCHVEEPRSSR